MARFEVYRLAGANDRYVLDVQSPFLAYLKSRVIVPLLEQTKVKTPATELNPLIDVLDRRFVVITQELTGVPVRLLGRPIVPLAASYWDQITRALDLLLTGF